MAKDFEALVEELKNLKNAEEEAEKIVENAEREAEKIIRDAEEQAASLMSEAEAETKKAAQDMRQKADAAITSEVDNLEKEFIWKRREMKNKVSENINEAVSYIFNRVLKTEV